MKITKEKLPKKITSWKACLLNFKKKPKEELILERVSNQTWAICLEEPIYLKHRRVSWSIKLRQLINSNMMLKLRYFTSTIYKTGAMMQKKTNLVIQTFSGWQITNFWKFYQKSLVQLLRQIFQVKTILSWRLFFRKKFSGCIIVS